MRERKKERNVVLLLPWLGVRKRMQIEQQHPATVGGAQMLVSSAPEHPC